MQDFVHGAQECRGVGGIDEPVGAGGSGDRPLRSGTQRIPRSMTRARRARGLVLDAAGREVGPPLQDDRLNRRPTMGRGYSLPRSWSSFSYSSRDSGHSTRLTSS